MATKRRAKRGERKRQIEEFFAEHPDASNAEAAQAVGSSASYVAKHRPAHNGQPQAATDASFWCSLNGHEVTIDVNGIDIDGRGMTWAQYEALTSVLG